LLQMEEKKGVNLKKRGMTIYPGRGGGNERGNEAKRQRQKKKREGKGSCRTYGKGGKSVYEPKKKTGRGMGKGREVAFKGRPRKKEIVGGGGGQVGERVLLPRSTKRK